MAKKRKNGLPVKYRSIIIRPEYPREEVLSKMHLRDRKSKFESSFLRVDPVEVLLKKCEMLIRVGVSIREEMAEMLINCNLRVRSKKDPVSETRLLKFYFRFLLSIF